MKKLADISKFESLSVNNGIGVTFKAKDYENFAPYSFPSGYEVSVREKYPEYERDDHWQDVYDRANGLWIDDNHSNDVMSALQEKINGKNKRERESATKKYYGLLKDKEKLSASHMIDDDFQIPVPYVDMNRMTTPDVIDWRETVLFDDVKKILDRFAKKDTFDFGQLSEIDRRTLANYFFGPNGHGDRFWGDEKIRDYLKDKYGAKGHEREGESYAVHKEDADVIIDRLGKRGASWTVDDLVNRIRRELEKAKE